MNIGLKPITIPKGLFVRPAQLRKVIRNTLEARAQDIKIDYDSTTQTWETKPKFYIKRPAYNIRIVGTDSNIYKWVDKGTKSHPIEAKNKPFLRFQTQFAPKTKPKTLVIGPGKISPPWAKKRRVRHPGTKAREFTKIIVKKWDKLIPNIMERAIVQELS